MKIINIKNLTKSLGIFSLILTGLEISAQEIEKPAFKLQTTDKKKSCGKSSSCQESCNKEKAKITLNGSVDAYHRYNYLASNIRSKANSTPTVFANNTGFSLGTANLIALFEKGNVGAVVDAFHGERAEIRAATERSSSLIGNTLLNEAYVFWNISEKTKISLGKMTTFLGYEKLASVDNFNYSSSYAFNAIPFTYTGIKIDYKINDEFSAVASIFNQGNFAYSESDNYTIGAQLNYHIDKLDANIGTTYGKEGDTNISPVLLTNATATYKPCKLFSVGLDALYSVDLGDETSQILYNLPSTVTQTTTRAEEVYGFAVYPIFYLNEKLDLGLRGEYYGAEDIHNEGTDVVCATVTAAYKVGALTIKPELRLDHVRDNGRNDNTVFTDSNKEAVPNMGSFVLGAMYQF